MDIDKIRTICPVCGDKQNTKVNSISVDCIFGANTQVKIEAMCFKCGSQYEVTAFRDEAEKILCKVRSR